MPRSDAIPLSQSSAPPQAQATGRAAAGPLSPAAAPSAAQTPPAAGGDDLGSTAIWDKPASASWGDYALAHLAKPFQGVGQAADDYARAISDTASFGLADRLAAHMNGTDLAQEQARTQAAHQRLGVMDYAASAIGYAPVGELGIASKIGGKLAPAIGNWAGGVLGSGLEGAGAGALGAAGHGDDIGSSALIGGALGGAGGALGGVVGRGGKLAPAVSADALKAQATQAYAPLSTILYDGKGEVHPRLDAAASKIANTDLTGQQSALAKSTMAEVNNLRARPQFTGEDIQKAQARLDKIASSPSATDQDKWLAPQYSQALEDVLQNGISPNAPTGFAASARDAGDVFSGRAKDVQRLRDWQDAANVAGGPDVGSQAKSYLLSGKGQTFAPPGSPQHDAINTLAGTRAGPDVSGAPSAWDVRHGLHPLVAPLLGGAALGAGGQIAQGHFDPQTLLAEAAGGMALGYGLHKGVPAFQAKFMQGPEQQRALAAARSALSTGTPQSPVLPLAPFRDAVMKLIYGQGAGGAF